jgi:hypothetical protein
MKPAPYGSKFEEGFCPDCQRSTRVEKVSRLCLRCLEATAFPLGTHPLEPAPQTPPAPPASGGWGEA